MRVQLTHIAAAALLAVAAPLASATVLTFDDLSGSGPMVDGYGGLNWTDWYFYDDVQPPYTPASPPTRLYDLTNDNAMWSTTAFTFGGADFAGYDFATVQFQMYLAGSLVATSGTLAPSSTPTFLASGYSGLVDKVVVVSPSPDYFVMDNVVVNAVPEPTTYALMALGLALLTVVGRRKA